MSGRNWIAAIAGGIALFVWGFLSHMVLQLGEAGIKTIPAATEDAVLSTLKGSLNEHGFYIFPGYDVKGHPSDAEMKTWEEKYKSGPIGVLIYDPAGKAALSPRQLVTELFSNIVAAAIVVYILSLIPGGFMQRVLVSVLLGFFSWMVLSVPYWNWYDFPSDFILAEGFDQILSWLLVGLVLAKMVRPRAVA
ncbi:MAG TPA: hypothetical protein VFR10_04310 [bacterium]|nr:hypothetical protein [bacterium]